MVTLGFIKNRSQCPRGTPRIFVQRGLSSQAPTLRSWREHHVQTVELRWDVQAGHDPSLWQREMALAISDLNWKVWWLDAQSIASVTGLPLGKGLTAWGLGFWGHYRAKSSIFIQIGEDGRQAVEKSVDIWMKTFSHVFFDQHLDIDLQVRQKAEDLKDKPVRRTIARFFPALFNRL